MTLTAFFSGLMFSLGLVIAGVVHPGMVQDFLDITAAWNPAAGLMLLTAVVTAAPAFYWISRNRYKTLLRMPSFIPRARPLSLRVVLGSAMFGIGWGLSGFDPGPGLIAAGGGDGLALIFVLAVGAGLHMTFKMHGYQLRRRRMAESSR